MSDLLAIFSEPFAWPFLFAVCGFLTHEYAARWVLQAIGEDSALAQEMFTKGNAWLGPKPKYMNDPSLLRARYWILWRRLPAAVHEEPQSVQVVLFIARLAGFLAFVSILWFFLWSFFQV